MSKATAKVDKTAGNTTLYLAFELGEKEWKLGFTIGAGQTPRRRTVTARDLVAVRHEIRLAKQRFGLAADARVLSCYEAGREGFWLHRALRAEGIETLVVDSASIEVNRRAKHTKTDRIDAGKLVGMLIRYDLGECKLWSVVHVPSVEAEDLRHLHRELLSLKADRTRHNNRIKGALANQGVRLEVGPDFREHLKVVRRWDGTPLPVGMCTRLDREYACWLYLDERIKEVEAERAEVIRTSQSAEIEQVRQLLKLKGIGDNSAWLFEMEFFGWREFHNRRQVGSLAGLCGTPFQSGDLAREQGISKAGNSFVRAMAIEIAWGWLRHQPDSELSRWFEERFGQGSKRLRKIGIVALARKLLVALWRYLDSGEVPADALLKA